jgi:hypothetical protein
MKDRGAYLGQSSVIFENLGLEKMDQTLRHVTQVLKEVEKDSKVFLNWMNYRFD